MIDIEKVIKGLYACTTFGENGATDGDCNICPYNKGYKTGECWVQMNRDAMELLKEQEEEIENLKQTAQSMMEGVCLLKEQEAETEWCERCGRVRLKSKWEGR